MTETLMPEGLGGRLVLSAADYRRNRGLWLKARRSGLGASDTATILGLNDWSTPLQVWQEKTSTVPPDDSDTSEAAHWGNVLEHPVAVQTVKKHRHLGKIMPTPGLLAHKDHPWMLATVDRLLVDRGTTGPVRSLLEVKTTSVLAYRAHWVDGIPPARIQVQVQQQLAVTELPGAWVTCLVGGQQLADPVWVPRSEEVIGQLIHYGGMWWRDHVEGMLRPEPTFGDRGRLAELWPADAAADAITAGPELEQIIADLADAKRRKAVAEEQEQQAAFKLKTAMKERTGVVNSSGELLATWKKGTSRRFQEKKFKADHPDLAAEYSPAVEGRGNLLLTKAAKGEE
ncbi:RecE-like exonuclease [Arthrobacter phage Galaxy]|uniref:RecE-like exonuclease n=1 Tax=Arthrobacter phage Galaxy TaxID=1772326 RepID=A0A0U4JKN8_9CAUD|nr:RecE-like recombination exonuclease [Arthrobacter phage Galaxy]ALY08881.1 RecE-like exonuclease [Arthrobacter phage Galaxy]